MDLLPLCCTFVLLFSTTTFCNAALTTTCSTDEECKTVANSKCPVDGNSKVCTCVPTFKEDAHSEACVAKVLGDACSVVAECAGIVHSECVGETDALKCTCVTTHKPVNGECVLKTVLGGTCTVAGGECTDVANSECVGDPLECTCKPTHKTEVGKCVAKTGLGDACSESSECDTEDAVCGSVSGKCNCGDGFVAQSGACKVAVNDDCSGANSGKCVGNAECNNNNNKCACAANYVPAANFCVPENGSRGNLASILVVILSLATAFQF